MTDFQNLEKTIKSYHRQLAMCGLMPFFILCLLVVFLFFHDKSFLHDHWPVMAGFGAWILMIVSCTMLLSHSFLPEIIRNVNNCWEEFIQNDLSSKMTEFVVEQVKRFVNEFQAQELLEKKELIEKHYKDIVEYQRDIKQLMEDERLMNEKINKIIEEYESKKTVKPNDHATFHSSPQREQ